MNRRPFLKLVVGSAAVGALCSCDEKGPSILGAESVPRYSKIPSLSGEPTPRAELHSLLEELRLAFEAVGRHVSTTLMPALSDSELRRKCSWFPGEISPELFAIYSWRGGQKQTNDSSEFWLRDMILSTPETAEVEYQSMMETYGKYLPSEDVGVELATCFPFAAFNGGWYVFPCGGQALNRTHPRGIISVFQGLDVYFYSMESMLRTCIDWVRHPLYQGNPTQWGNVEMELWQKHNPGIFGR